MKILIDRHHAGLLYSLQLLFEDTFGMEAYVPIGHEWWDEGYWRFGQVFGDDRLAQQYLVQNHLWRRGPFFWETEDVEYPERPIFGVTVEQAREMEWWGVMATVQENQHGLARFAKEVGARYLYQIGNTGQQVDWDLDPLALVSAEANIPEGRRAVRYHQRFDLDVFHARQPSDADRRRIASFVNCFPLMPTEWQRFNEVRTLLPEFDFRVHGHDGPDGRVVPTTAVAAAMRACGFAWHDKPQGDGFGHIIHGWAASGIPLIGTAAYYKGRQAEQLWQDGVTSINLDGLSADRVAERIREVAEDPGRWFAMRRAIRERFEQLVDPQVEEHAIRALLDL